MQHKQLKLWVVSGCRLFCWWWCGFEFHNRKHPYLAEYLSTAKENFFGTSWIRPVAYSYFKLLISSWSFKIFSPSLFVLERPFWKSYILHSAPGVSTHCFLRSDSFSCNWRSFICIGLPGSNICSPDITLLCTVWFVRWPWLSNLMMYMNSIVDWQKQLWTTHVGMSALHLKLSMRCCQTTSNER